MAVAIMTNPIQMLSNNRWFGDHDPGSSEIMKAGAVEVNDEYTNTETGNKFLCTDSTRDALKWSPLSPVAKGSSYTQQPIPIFTNNISASRVPNTSKATFVIASASLTALCSITPQIDEGVGFTPITGFKADTLTTDITPTILFIVPPGASYRFIRSQTGTVILNSVFELTL